MRRALYQNAAQTMLLDCSRAETFILRLGTSVETLLLKKVSPGMLYVFMLRQDAKGNHKMNWGANVKNAVPPDPMPGSVTVQSFIANSDGTLEANTPGTWT